MKRLAIIAAVLLALVVTASAIIEAYGEATSPKAPTSTLSGTPLDPGVAQQVEHRLKPEVAGAEPASGVTGGVPTEAQARTAVLGALVAAQRLRGVASWYATPGLTGAAGPVLRDALGGDPAFRGERVTVCSARCVTVVLSDWCQCPERGGQPTLIDLSDAAFSRLAPLSRGIASVTVTVGGPEPTLPPTSTEGEP